MTKKNLLVACSVGLLTAGVWAGLLKNNVDTAERKHRDAESKAQRLRADWERVAGSVDLAEAG